ncbi:patched domain-containing protein 3 isoform X2 [Lepeophtheirus salmonis]|uniref:patched domain-containing protein 3 isoform X2 n=1 Tax=Lepeophtheirus salmonis TaxID=72036 RepID=UPI001AE5802C|nr:patched domain-containing protein 3-like isoform X2 [Lepeophtheirus salmonis]
MCNSSSNGLGRIDGCNRSVDKFLKRIFYKLGFLVGTHPGYFVIVPVLLTALCASGFQRVNYNYDPEYLFSPSTGSAKQERSILETYFPTNFSDFKASRISRPGKFGRIIVAAKDGGSMLDSNLWNQLLYLDQLVYNISLEYEHSTYTYTDLCAHWNSYCYDNEILRLSSIMGSVETGAINLTYPIYFDPNTFETYALPIFFGGVSLTDINTIIGVKAVALSYFLDVSEEWRDNLGLRWEKKFLDALREIGPYFAPDLEIGMFVSNTPAWEMEASKNSVTSTLCINVVIMVVFSLVSCLMSDATKSKPLVGFAGLFSATIATIAGFGFACYVGVEFISLNFAAPFLLLGIGVDDTFVILSSWRRSSSNLSIPERMGRCYSEAAVSITVTSLTDFFSFMAGVVTPFPCVRIFCLYTGISVAFIYFWHLTLFGAILAVSGRAEKNNLHGMFCIKVIPKSLAVNKSWLTRTFMTGGTNPKDPHNPDDNKDHAGMVFFRDNMGRLLSRTWFKSLVLLLFGAYIVVACWGVTNIEEGLEKQNMANYDSYSVKYYSMDDSYFREYSYTISVIITSASNERDLLYSDSKTQARIERVLNALENSTFIEKAATQSWLRDFLDYIKRNENYEDIILPVSTEMEFVDTLSNVYLSDPSNPLRLDVAYNHNKNGIIASRFLIQGRNILNSYMEQSMVAELRDICNQFSTPDISISVFHPYFIYIDQYLAIAPQTVQCILVTSLVMMIISFFLIPSLVCSFWVAFSIISIELGVIGYMTWWGVRLDGVALINLIMCIGFSVDFSAHICYHYITDTESSSPDERIRSSLYGLGLPIIQGATSTILGVLGLAFAPSYLFVTFFKMVFLVIVLGGLHGLIILPVLLSLFGPGSCRSRKSIVVASEVSTPSTTISCKMRKEPPSCYTVNLGYASSDNSLNSTPTRDHRSITSSPASSTSPTEDEENKKNKIKAATMATSTVIPTFKYAYHNKSATLSDVSNFTFPSTLDPVVEAEERNHQLAVITQIRSNGNMASLVPVIPPSSGRRSSKSNSTHYLHHRHHQHRPSLNIGSRNSHHKRICRSKSHRPDLLTIAPSEKGRGSEKDGDNKPQPSEFHPGGHAPLRKYHSFPYEMFNNETGYSSDESLRSGPR